MITAQEARDLEKQVWKAQLEQIEWGIKQSIIQGGDAIYYKKDKLKKATKDYLIELGYKVEESGNALLENEIKISWSEE